jgi:hypothetical protein
MCRLFVITGILFSLETYSQSIDISKNWLMTIGDTAEWSGASFNDENWKKIENIGLFENTGLSDFKNFGWARKKVIIPSSLKGSAEKYGFFYLSLGMINDADQTFFNGKLVGQTGSMPPAALSVDRGKRLYKLPVERILWDKENLIAVRIYSSFHNGGLSGDNFKLIIPSENIFHSTQKRIGEFPLPEAMQSYEISTQPDISFKQEALRTGGLTLKFNLPAGVPVLYNRKFIGKSTSSGHQSFFIAASYISWGKQDTITVYLNQDEPLGNILFSTPAFDIVQGNGFKFMQVLNFKIRHGSFEKNSPVTVSVEILNSTNSDFQGNLNLTLTTDINKIHQKSSQRIRLNKSESKEVQYTLTPDFSGIYQLNYLLQNNETGQTLSGILAKGEII